ncbi:MAG TPA: hypothetical protein VNS46_12395 [Nocardioides sp.]|nr:hypothetical protein [Nocardioides sp.]
MPCPRRSGPQGWQTISRDDVRAEVPADWVQVSCAGEPQPRWAPPTADPCGAWTGVGFFGSATFDPMMEPGVLLRSDDGNDHGYVYAGDFALSVSVADRALVRRILASARIDGEPVVDARQWVTFDRHGLVYEVPAWWGVGEAADRSEFSVCLVPAETAGRQAYSTGSSYVLTGDPGPAHVVRVVAPTQALAELVLDSVDSSSALAGQDCTPEDFATALLPGESSPAGVVQ